MNFNQIQNFITIAETGSFTAAAEKLFVSPQALMQQVATMERELGFALFLRNSKGVRLSAGGEEYYTGVKRLLADYRDLAERASQAACALSVLRIGLPDNVNPAFLLSICKRFSEVHPEIRLSYETYSRPDTVKAILYGRADICAQIKTDEESPYYSERLFPVEQFCILSKNNPLAKRKALRVEDLAGHTVGVWDTLSPYKGLLQYVADRKLPIEFHNLQGEISDALVFCMAGNILIGSMPVVNYLKSSMMVIPCIFDFGIYYSLIYREAGNRFIEEFISIAKEAANSESHPWKIALREYYKTWNR